MTGSVVGAAELRRRASVLVEFELPWLGVDLESDATALHVAELLSLHARLGPGRPDGPPRWRVREETRSAAAEGGIGALRASWRAVPTRPEHRLQEWIDRIIGAGHTPDLAALSPTDLECVAQVSRWFDAAGGPVPAFADVDRRMRLELMLEPLRQVRTEHFRDRVSDLARLQSQRPGRPILVHGRGGLGKSALVAKLLLEAVESGTRIAYLNFDHNALNPLVPAGLVVELVRQLSWQLPASAGDPLRWVEEEARAMRQFGDSATSTASRDLDLHAEQWRSFLPPLASAMRDTSVLVAFDTLEEAQRRDPDLVSLTRLVGALAELPGWHIVASGRAPVPALAADAHVLDGLPPDDAAELLISLLAAEPQESRVELPLGQARDVLDLVGTSPLCVRLAAGILRSTTGEVGPLRDLELQSGVLEGELYRRLLGYIEDPDVSKIAYPGLTLRRITPELIQRVLARPCDVEVPDARRARELFDGLSREAMLVERRGNDEVVHRSDVRPLMLERLARDNRDAVRSIHRAAVAYYRRQPGTAARVEELYHRLMLEQSARTLDANWDQSAYPELKALVSELPASGRAYLIGRDPELESRFSSEELAQIDEARLRPVLQRQAERLVASGEVAQAAELLARSRTTDGAPLLPLLELQVRELLGDLEGALALGQQEEARRARTGDVAGVVTAALHTARVLQQLDRASEAGQHLADLARQLQRSTSRAVTDLLRLQFTVSQLRMERFGSTAVPRDHLVQAALFNFGHLPPATLRREPALLRDLAGELGEDAPVSVLTAALEVGRLEDEDGAVSDALADFDASVSQSRGRDHGVLADIARAEPVDVEKPTESWQRWLSSGQSNKVAGEVGKLIKQFEGEVPSGLGNSIANSFRAAGDRATSYRADQ